MPIINISYSSSERPNYDPRALMALGPQITVDILPPLVVEKWARSSGNQVKQTYNLAAP